jgi:alpha-glucosidase
MTKFSLRQILDGVSPSMIVQGLIHPVRTAFRELRSGTFQRSSNRPAWLPIDAFTFLGDVASVQTGDRDSLTVRASGGSLRVLALADDLLQLRFRPEEEFPSAFSYSVEHPEEDWKGTDAKITETGTQVELATGTLSLIVEKKPFHLALRDASGRDLLCDALGAGHHLVSGQIFWRAKMSASGAIYGLGEKADALNHTGKRFELWNSDPVGYDRGSDPLYMSIPFLMILVDGHAVGLFFDNTYRVALDLGTSMPGELEYRAAGGELRLYLMVGTPQSVLERYTELTGRSKLPPLWTLGFHQSRWSYYPDKRVREIARELRQRRLPCDAIHLDIHYMDGYRCFTWNRKRFPDPRGLLADLHRQGFKTVSIIDPGIKIDPKYRVYQEGKAAGAFIEHPGGVRFTGPVWPGSCHFPDFADPQVRTWWGELYRGLLDDGIDAFWNDMNEPALITGRAGGTVPISVRHRREGEETTHTEIHNVYGLLMARASVEGIGKLRPDHRPFILSRSGWAGLQRYAIHWTADNRSTWDHLRLSVQMILSLGLSGIPIAGADIGGFTGGPTPELFARWMQVGAFTPFFRVHSMQGSPNQEPWAFGPEVEAISRQYIELRYRLLPYLYTAAWQAATSGTPIARPLSFVYPEDRSTYDLDDGYLFGDSFLVAPILEEGAARRPVYLPAGEWVDFWNLRHYQGGQTITVDAPIEKLPLFVRAGSIIPLWPVQQYVGEQTIDTLTFQVYWAAGEHSSLLYEDDGLCSDYALPENHRLSVITLRSDASGSGQIYRTIKQGEYQPQVSKIVLDIIGLENAPTSVSAAAGQIIDKVWNAQEKHLLLTLEATGTFEIRLE